MRVCVLGSSSRGNATFVSDGTTRLLIDTGNLPILKYIRSTLAAIGEDWTALDAIVVSHAHGDHLNANTFSVAARTDTPVYLQAAVAKTIERYRWGGWGPFLGTCQARGLVRSAGGHARIGSLEVEAFPVPHDCEPTVGFVVTGGDGRRLGVATDLGHCPAHVAERLRNCDLLVFEANHDEAMERDSGQPWELIQRNLGPFGHLSNAQSAAALAAIIDRSRRRPQAVLLAHLSQECNTPELAVDTVQAHLRRHGLGSVAVEPTFARRPSVVIHLAGRRRGRP